MVSSSVSDLWSEREAVSSSPELPGDDELDRGAAGGLVDVGWNWERSRLLLGDTSSSAEMLGAAAAGERWGRAAGCDTWGDPDVVGWNRPRSWLLVGEIVSFGLQFLKQSTSADAVVGLSIPLAVSGAVR